MVSFSFGHSLYELILIGTHRNLCYVYITVRHHHHTEILFLRTFTGSGELRNSSCRRSLGRLTARIGINFRIKDEDIDILILCEDMVYTAETDIVGPAVTTEDPVRTFYKILFVVEECFENRLACSFFFKKCRYFIGTFTCAFAFSKVGSPIA